MNSTQSSLPALVIVGRPNVGKSTLFNQLTRTRRSIVGDEPGITRDRIHGEAQHEGKRFEVIDTGGIIPNDDELIPSQILKQARTALDKAAHIVFVIDGRTEITSADRDLAKMLRRLGKPVSLAVNKIDAPVRESLAHEFYELGFPDLFPVSAEHRLGLDDLLDHATGDFAQSAPQEPAAEPPKIRVAIIGRPNAGKSTLLNMLTGADEFVADMPFATLDTRTRQWRLGDGRTVLLSDTVGFVQRLPHHLVASFHATLEEALNVELLMHVIDAAHPDAAVQLAAVEQTLGGLTLRKADVLALNKVDRVLDPLSIQPLLKDRHEEVVQLSARTGAGLDELERVVSKCLDARSPVVEARVSAGDGKSIAALKAAGSVLEQRVDDEGDLVLRLRLLDSAFGALQSMLGMRVRFRILEPASQPFFKGD